MVGFSWLPEHDHSQINHGFNFNTFHDYSFIILCGLSITLLMSLGSGTAMAFAPKLDLWSNFIVRRTQNSGENVKEI